MTFEKKIALISGAGHGLGRALAILLSQTGAQVILVSKTQERLEKTAEGMANPPLMMVEADLSDNAQINAFIEKLNRTLPHLDFLFNNVASPWFEASFADTPTSHIDNLLAVSFRAGLLLTHGLLGQLKKSNSARIVNILSSAALLRPERFQFAPLIYSAVKAGAAAFSEGLRNELRPLGIGVISVYPGPFANTSQVHDPEDVIAEKTKGGKVLHVRALAESILWAAATPPPLLVESLTLGALTPMSV